MILGFSGYLIFGRDCLARMGGYCLNSILRFDHWAGIRENHEDYSSLRGIVCHFRS
jgi:hypothetical protein